MGRIIEFWGRETKGNNDSETMFNEKNYNADRKLKFNEFEVFVSMNFQ